MNTRNRTYDWEDPAPLASQAKQLAGLDFLKKMINAELPLPPLIHTLDFKVSSIQAGRAEFSFQPQEFHYNPLGTVHGGVITAIPGFSHGIAHFILFFHWVTGYTSVDIKVNFLKAINIKNGLVESDWYYC